MEKKILEKLAIISCLLSFLIVCHHAFTKDINYIGSFDPTMYGTSTSIQRLLYNISECAVPVFYFLSAYLFFRSYDGSWQNYKKKIYRRFFSLLIPYVIFCTLGYIKHELVSGERNGVLGWLTELYLCETMPLWFIRELLALSLLAPCFYWIKKHWYTSALTILAIIILISIGYVKYRSFVYWIPVYLLGVNLNKNNLDNIAGIVKKYRYVCILLILLYIVSCWFLPNGSRTNFVNLVYILFRIVTPLIFIPILIYITESNIKTREWMNFAFFVYCMHFPVITVLSLLYDKWISSFFHNHLFKYFIIVFFSYSLCVIMAILIQRFLPKIWNVINGGR